MKCSKILLILVLFVFITGMMCGTVSASHTFKLGKYKGTISDKQYDKLVSAKKDGRNYHVTVKTGKYEKIKITKWKKKTIWQSTIKGGIGHRVILKQNPKAESYLKQGWKIYSYDHKTGGADIVKHYWKLKKSYNVFKKYPLKMRISTMNDDLQYSVGDYVEIIGYEGVYKTKNINLG